MKKLEKKTLMGSSPQNRTVPKNAPDDIQMSSDDFISMMQAILQVPPEPPKKKKTIRLESGPSDDEI